MRSAVIPIIIFLTFPATLRVWGQVQARQGEPAKDDTHRFHSPMILDLPLSVTDPSLWDAGQIRTERENSIRKYVCDGVSFLDFAISATRHREGKVQI